LTPFGKKNQDIYLANIDYEATREEIWSKCTKFQKVRVGGGRYPAESHIIVEVDDYKESVLRGLESFLIRLGTNTADAHTSIQKGFQKKIKGATILVSPKGKIQISYGGLDERNTVLEFLKNNLVPQPDEELKLTPICLDPFVQDIYIELQKQTGVFLDDLYRITREWFPGRNELAMTEPFPILEEILEKSMPFLATLIQKLIKEEANEVLRGERPVSQIESEYLAMIQGLVFELFRDIMEYSSYKRMHPNQKSASL